MEYVLNYILVYLVIFVILYILTFVLKSKTNSLESAKSFMFITRKYDLKLNKKRVRLLSKIIVVANSFILSIPIYLILVVDLEYFLSLIISFLIFIILILIIYNLIGNILKKKGW